MLSAMLWQRFMNLLDIIGMIDFMRRPTIWILETIGAFPELRSRLTKPKNVLSEKQHAAFVAKLKEHVPCKVAIMHKDGLDEFAYSLEGAFIEAGWQAKAVLSLRVVGKGVSLHGTHSRQPDAASHIREAFVAAAIPLSYETAPIQYNTFGAQLTISVGSNPLDN
jgi:hypothetical protein